MSLEYVLSLFTLMLISVGTFGLATRLKLPYTVLLVLVGTLLVPLSALSAFSFIKAFTLTPELLFYIFLPILIFESAYNMRIRELMENIRTISWLSVVSLVISMFVVAGLLFYFLGTVGLAVPFLVTLLFGALISATDPVAVLALFKEFGVPKRLSFLFEGESLFNDGTSLAAFLIVLEIIVFGFHGAATIFQAILTFATMVLGGVAFGVFMGFVFAKLIEHVKHEHVEMTLTLLVAHLTFILSEVLSHHLMLWGEEVRLSSIIATVMASMVIGNYGRSKFSPRVKRFLEPFWGYFAFLANSLVFITMGLLFAGLPIDLEKFLLPVLVAVGVVIIARSISIYPVVGWLNIRKKERLIPLSWQHLLSWGSLRGALAIIMVLLIPEDLTLAGWAYDFSVKEFVTALAIGCIYFTLFIKATTIGPIIKHFRLDALSETQVAEYRQSRVFIFSYALERLESFLQKGYIHDATHHKLKERLMHLRDEEYRRCEEILTRTPERLEDALRLYALGIEKYFLALLFRYREISENVYKRILTKLDAQEARVEEGHHQIASLREQFPLDWFERLARFLRRIWGKKMTEQERLAERYMYYRAQTIITRKVLKELRLLKNRSRLESAEYQKTVDRVLAAYEAMYRDAEGRMKETLVENSAYLNKIDERFGREGMRKAFEDALSELTQKNMLPDKIAILLENEFSRH